MSKCSGFAVGPVLCVCVVRASDNGNKLSYVDVPFL
jgi:hypothetical protein